MKTAVLLYGFSRTYKRTAKSLLTNIVDPNNADIFIATYDNEGVSIINNSDINKSKKNNSCVQDLQGSFVSFDTLKDAYGERLIDCHIESYNESKFIEESKSINSPLLPIHRFFSLYYNMSKSAELMKKYSDKNNIKYDCIFIMRPDLLIYNKIYANKLNLNAINIPRYCGNISDFGVNSVYKVCSYRNIERMEYIPFESVSFTDQFIVSSYEILQDIDTLYSKLHEYDSYGLPICHPETTLYYHLAYHKKIEIKLNDFNYEILRSNFREYSNTFNANQHSEACTNSQLSVCEATPKVLQLKPKKYEKYKKRLQNDFFNIRQGKNILTNLAKFIIYYAARR